ncbi:uncharacterized protein LOC115070983 isoform X2 [Nannospalax galili]|uniref:uncharacterized protein LOC115070983 isoform X2 n=1 Tax=Nannospalax galili TaxID=1026970 RepID=UPI00111C7D7A|nr:uncharacterized protein LOC115070983 isoform X2 [Nannospalax galili]
MDTAVVSREGNMAAGDAAAAAAASYTSPENGSILQIKCKKTEKQPFPVPKEEDDGLKKKILDAKNKSTEHSNVMDDCQISQSVSEDYDLPNRDPIVTQLINQLQMHQKGMHELQKKVQELEYETAQKELELFKLRKQLTEKEEQYKKEVEEKHQCEMCRKRQEEKDTVLRSSRFDTDKVTSSLPNIQISKYIPTL